MNEKLISARVLRVGLKTEEIQVKIGSTVRDIFQLLSIAEEEYPNRFIEGEAQGAEGVLKDGDKLFLTSSKRGEATIKANGKWRVRKADPDCLFPSDFHAHRLDAPEKLDIYTGEVYSARDNRYLRKLRKKSWICILDGFSHCKEEEIKSKAIQTMKNLDQC
jgi:hypothetical protein